MADLNDISRSAISREMLRDFFMPLKTKAALAQGVCTDCAREMEVIDTWERACHTLGCEYTFNYYHRPWITAELPPENAHLNHE